jgi:hypothetical protein
MVDRQRYRPIHRFQFRLRQAILVPQMARINFVSGQLVCYSSNGRATGMTRLQKTVEIPSAPPIVETSDSHEYSRAARFGQLVWLKANEDRPPLLNDSQRQHERIVLWQMGLGAELLSNFSGCLIFLFSDLTRRRIPGTGDPATLLGREDNLTEHLPFLKQPDRLR